jgi:hypothetical protein
MGPKEHTLTRKDVLPDMALPNPEPKSADIYLPSLPEVPLYGVGKFLG